MKTNSLLRMMAFILGFVFLNLMSNAKDETPRKLILVIGNAPSDDAGAYDSVLIDTLNQYVDVLYMSAGDFNAASYDSLYSQLGIEGILISESIGSNDVPNFGVRDVFPVPSIVFEAGCYTNSWGEVGFMSESGGVWGYGGGDATEADLQWVIKDNFHPSIEELGYSVGQTITYSTSDPTRRGVPYLHGFDTQVNVIAVGGRTDGGGNADYDQELAVAVAEFPIQQSLFMNISRAYHDPELGTQEFFDMLRQAAFYMYDIAPAVVLSEEPASRSTAISLYPNPVVETISLDLVAGQAQDVWLTLVNMNGQQVAEFSKPVIPGANKLSFDLGGINSGVYFLNITVDGTTERRKLILNSH